MLVTGGAGYIGSHVVRALLKRSWVPIVVDDLSTGRQDRLPDGVAFYQVDLGEHEVIAELLRRHGVSSVVHLAGRKQARESRRQPLPYWTTNVTGMISLLSAIESSDVSSFVFSSSCSVYGSAGPVGNDSQYQPISPYARTKVVGEWVMSDVAPSLGLKWAALQYFNVIGAGPFPYSYDTSPESLLPAATASWSRGMPVPVFGMDFETPDGTALRDYVDVEDLAEAHINTLEALVGPKGTTLGAVALGSGQPVSVLSLLRMLATQFGIQPTIDEYPRNPADPDTVWVADLSGAERIHWKATTPITHSISNFVQAIRR